MTGRPNVTLLVASTTMTVRLMVILTIPPAHTAFTNHIVDLNTQQLYMCTVTVVFSGVFLVTPHKKPNKVSDTFKMYIHCLIKDFGQRILLITQ